MNRQNIIDRLIELQLPQKEYWVLTGAAMVLYGFKEETADIDLGCSKYLADILDAKGYFTEIMDDGKRHIVISTDVELFEEWIEDVVVNVCQIPVISVSGLISIKKKLARKKDLIDIDLIYKHIM